jgi:pyruvate/2-oxoglutarate dehydrogenase complex dihydrolipoamide dehydrogenase (E3) component
MGALGVKVTLIEGRNEVLGFLDRETSEALMYQMRRAGITLRLGEKVARIEEVKPNCAGNNEPAVKAVLESGNVISAQTLLYALGRQGTTEAVRLDRAGVAQYKELARGPLLGDAEWLLKLLIHQETHEILGVHAIGIGVTELIHIGQAVMAYKGTVEFFINNVFNYPTLAEAYKVAALNGLNKIRHV